LFSPLRQQQIAVLGRNAQYPRVSHDGWIIFRVSAREAQKVAIQPLNGNVDHADGLGKEPFPMAKDKVGITPKNTTIQQWLSL
jgi:hypothetical protein